MVLDESDTDWNDSEEEMSDSEDLATSLIEAQEDMVDPLRVAQDISNDDDNNEPEMITTSITSQVPSMSNTSGPTSLPTPSSASVLSLPSVCQQPSMSSNVPELSNRIVPIPFAQPVGPTEPVRQRQHSTRFLPSNFWERPLSTTLLSKQICMPSKILHLLVITGPTRIHKNL